MESVLFSGEVFALGAAISWATAVILFRKSGETVHPLALSLFKSTQALVLFLFTLLALKEPLFRDIPVRDYILFLTSGVIGIGVCDTLFFLSLNILGAGLSAIVGCLYSPSIITMSMLFLGESLSITQIGGAVMILLAVTTATQAKAPGGVTRRQMLWGIALGVLAILCNAIGIVMIKPLLDSSPILWVTELRLLSGCIFLAIVFWIRSDRNLLLKSLLSGNRRYTISGSLVGTYLAMLLWLAGMKFTQASTAAVLNQTSNIFVFTLAAIFLREPITRIRLFGIIVGATGVFLVTFG